MTTIFWPLSVMITCQMAKIFLPSSVLKIKKRGQIVKILIMAMAMTFDHSSMTMSQISECPGHGHCHPKLSPNRSLKRALAYRRQNLWGGVGNWLNFATFGSGLRAESEITRFIATFGRNWKLHMVH